MKHTHLPFNWETEFERTNKQADFRLFVGDTSTAQRMVDDNIRHLQHYRVTECLQCQDRINNIQNAIDDIRERLDKRGQND